MSEKFEGQSQEESQLDEAEKSNSEKRWESSKEYQRKEEELRRMLGFYDLHFDDDYTKIIEEINKSGKISDKERGHLLEETHKSFLNLADSAMENDGNLHMGFKLCKSLGLIDKIKERVDKGPLAIDGQTYVDLTAAILEYGSDDQAEEALKSWMQSGRHILLEMEESRYLKERLYVIEDAYAEFCKEFYPEKQYGLNGQIPSPTYESKTEWINAAMEIKKKNYDVVVGVLKSGVLMASLLDFLGQNTRYAEWHRGWKKGPVWKKIGSNTDKPEQAEKILVCEHDTKSGETLKALEPFLKKLNPGQIDISFWIDLHNANQRNVDRAGYFTDDFHVKDITTENLVKNLNEALEHAKLMKK